MKFAKVGLVLAASALALGACSKGGDINHGGKVVLPGGGSTLSKQVPANLPDYVKVYPGAVVTAVMDNGARGGVITFDVSDPPDTVVAFYKKTAADAKLDSGMDSWSLNQDHSGPHVMMFDKAGTHRSLSASVEVKDGKTHVGLIYGGAV
ncbi:MAG TPA: hypothetical protein VG939_03580 [Caulobacteraceae bacterium]|nr:hypothetical protein [Caulobacteraceae bacterium]